MRMNCLCVYQIPLLCLHNGGGGSAGGNDDDPHVDAKLNKTLTCNCYFLRIA